MAGKIAGVGTEAVESATGNGWQEWLAFLDDQDGTTLDHKGRVAVLADAGVESGWWQQKIAVGYEKQRGLRETGETSDSGYQVGVQRTVPVSPAGLWEYLTSEEGIALWLGEAESISLTPGDQYQTTDGTAGEIRTRSDGERLRLTWKPAGRVDETTLQLSLIPSDGGDEKTALRFHHEKLADTAEREEIRAHWRHVLDGIEDHFDD